MISDYMQVLFLDNQSCSTSPLIPFVAEKSMAKLDTLLQFNENLRNILLHHLLTTPR